MKIKKLFCVCTSEAEQVAFLGLERRSDCKKNNVCIVEKKGEILYSKIL